MAKIKAKTKGIIKKVALVLAGVSAITAVGFGVKAIVDYTKEDLKTITPSFEVGNLGSDGKFVDDESTLYTKEAFGCYGLQVKPDFDSKVNYQIYYYDILDNYISSTAVLSDGFSEEAPVNGAYARMVIEPRDDEDGKISWTEKHGYTSQLTVKVKKEQDINERFGVLQGKLYQVVSKTNDLVFEKGLTILESPLRWVAGNHCCVTSSTVLKVDGGITLNFDNSKLGEKYSASHFVVHAFKDLPSNDTFLKNNHVNATSFAIDSKTKYVYLSVVVNDVSFVWEDSVVALLPSCFTITRTN